MSQSLQTEYEDLVNIVAEVRGANLRASEGGTLTLLLADGALVDGVFNPDQEAVITNALHNHRTVRVHIEGMAEFDRAGQMRKIVRIDRLEEREVEEKPFDPNAEPIWSVISAIGASIPEEEWDRVPADLSINLDHYLYGHPKVE